MPGWRIAVRQLTLHGIIDDATGEVAAAAFRPAETLEGYVTVMIEGLRRKGVPLALYSDQHAMFHPPKGKPTLEQELAGETNSTIAPPLAGNMTVCKPYSVFFGLPSR